MDSERDVVDWLLFMSIELTLRYDTSLCIDVSVICRYLLWVSADARSWWEPADVYVRGLT